MKAPWAAHDGRQKVRRPRGSAASYARGYVLAVEDGLSEGCGFADPVSVTAVRYTTTVRAVAQPG